MRGGHHAVARLWGWIAAAEAVYFVALAPMLGLAAWSTSRILGFPLVNAPYLRSCGALAAPMTLCYLAAWTDGPLRWAALVATLPALFIGLKGLFDLDGTGGAIGGL